VPTAVGPSGPPCIGRVWLPVTFAAAWVCTTFVALSLPAPSALYFSLTTHAAALLLVLTWWPFVARHKTRPAFRFSMSVAFALGLLVMAAGYFSITFPA
ncbi:MAG TPA: hypothetical protein VHY37_06940, partial [Tepidisphaeraceae bacterium]|nr:hypothetical protein [Tepidisphaeraceae bacterium]